MYRFVAVCNASANLTCLAGGDSAARGMIVGAVLGAYGGMEVIPYNHNAINKADSITRYIEMIDAKNA